MDCKSLKSAYLASGLWRQGYSYNEALAAPVLRDVLQRYAEARRKLMARRGERVPKQQDLAL